MRAVPLMMALGSLASAAALAAEPLDRSALPIPEPQYFGYAGSKTFGGVMNLPTLDRLAQEGLIYNNFHTAPICSASRVALLTGRNPHSANMGTVSEMATGFPGQTSSTIRPISRIMRSNRIKAQKTLNPDKPLRRRGG